MRPSFVLVIGLVAACGDNQEGLVLTVHAPGGPAGATRLEVVLASASQAAIDDVQNQRVAPTMLTGEDVRYYRQRARAGEVDNIGSLDGFKLRLEANAAMVPDTSLIPFLIAFDERDAIIGIGTVGDDSGAPTAVTIEPGAVLAATVEMTALAETDGNTSIAAGNVLRVACGPMPSGLAWQPGGTQLRLLLPDTANDPTAIDASARGLDMDCDGAEADVDDCDDLRAAFHDGAVEACDGMDVDCDGHRLEVVSCPTTTTTCGTQTGFSACLDVSGGGGSPVSTTCVQDADCACFNGTPCNECAMVVAGPGDPEVKVCEPYRADVTLSACGTQCDVEVVEPPNNPWRVALVSGGVLKNRLTGVTDNVTVQVELDSGDTLDLPATHRLGGIYLHVTPTQPSGPPVLESWNIKLVVGGDACGAPPTAMTCNTIGQ